MRQLCYRLAASSRVEHGVYRRMATSKGKMRINHQHSGVLSDKPVWNSTSSAIFCSKNGSLPIPIGSMYAIYGYMVTFTINISPMLASIYIYIYHTWILWDMKCMAKNTQCQLRINKPWFINCGGTLQIVTIWYINGPPNSTAWGVLNPGLTLTMYKGVPKSRVVCSEVSSGEFFPKPEVQKISRTALGCQLQGSQGVSATISSPKYSRLNLTKSEIRYSMKC